MSKDTDTAPAEDTAAETPAGKSGADQSLASAARKAAGKGVWMGTAVGIGSAAIVAALLYTNKKRS